MEQVESQAGKEIWVHQYQRETSLQLPFSGEFVCLIWNESDNLLPSEITKLFLEQGCRYVLCAGNLSNEQELDVDKIHVERSTLYLDTPHVMTTAHGEESIEEVTDFALNCTDFEENTFSRYLILYIEDLAS